MTSFLRCLDELCDSVDQLLALDLLKAQDPAAAALDVEKGVAVAGQEVGAGGAGRATALRPLRPRER